jgi:regulator of protease activity HflC (stomatin/prohibitin superfamily)
MTSFLCFSCIDAADKGVVQECGKFKGLADPGCSFLMWPMQTVTPVSMQTRQLDVNTNTKTSDNVTVSVKTAIMYHVDPENVQTFYFKLHNPHQQITAYVDDCIRSQIPTMTLDEAFESKEKMAIAVKAQVSESMKEFGVIVIKALMTDMQPDATVMASMNRINAAKRDREAAVEKAEADKILAVKAAEAEAEAKHLSGMGTAKMRHAITDGFRGSIESMKSSCGLEPHDVVHMMLVTQYLDVLKEFAQSGSATMVVPHGPSAVGDIEAQVRSGFMQAKMMPPNTANGM